MCVKERLIEFIKHKRVTKRQFYMKVGLSSGFLNKSKSIGSNKIRKIIQTYPELSIEWVVMGTGNMLHSTDERRDKQTSKFLLPLLDIATVVREPDLSLKNKSIIPIDHFSLGRGYVDCQTAIQVWGDSMHPEFCAGDIVVLRKVESLDHLKWGFVHLVITKEHQYFFNRVARSRDKNKICLLSAQPDPESFEINKEDIIRTYESRAMFRKLTY